MDAPDTAPLPAATNPGPVRLQVADLARSEAWYSRILGLVPLSRGNGWSRLAPAAGQDTLVELHERPGAPPVPRGGHLGLYHVALLLPDRSSLGSLVEHLARLGIPAGSADHLVSEALYLTDPDGLGLEVYADRPRDTWARTPTGEVAMASDPLDLEDLVAAAEGTSWDGAPAGTAVGHLHLHVGDLAAAESFYGGALGLDVQVRSYPGALFLSAGGYHHHLGVNTWARGARPALEDGARLLAWELRIPSAWGFDLLLERLEAANVPMLAEEVPPAGAAPGTVVSVSDPWGTVLRLRCTEERAD
jgi:catechol 2,3-dioxygenase